MTPQQILNALIDSGTPTRLVIEVARIVERLELLEVASRHAIERDVTRREMERQRQRKFRNKNKDGVTLPSRLGNVTECDATLREIPPPLKERIPPTPPKKENNPPIQTPTSLESGATAPRDIRDDLFKSGLQKLSEMTGKTPDACRSVVGKWLKLVDDEAIHVLGAIEDAHRNRVADPVPWIFERLKPFLRGQPNGYQKLKTVRDVGNELIAELHAKAGRSNDNPGSHNGVDAHAIGIPRNSQGVFPGVLNDIGRNPVPVPARSGNASMLPSSRSAENMQVIPSNGRTDR